MIHTIIFGGVKFLLQCFHFLLISHLRGSRLNELTPLTANQKQTAQTGHHLFGHGLFVLANQRKFLKIRNSYVQKMICGGCSSQYSMRRLYNISLLIGVYSLKCLYSILALTAWNGTLAGNPLSSWPISGGYRSNGPNDFTNDAGISTRHSRTTHRIDVK